MLFIKRTYLFILAIIITLYAVPRDELLWLWVSVSLVVLGVVNLRNDKNTKLISTSRLAGKGLVIIGVIAVVIVIIYVLMVRSFSNSFDR
jgi:hypothetical protein